MSDDLFELGERIADLAARINIATFDMLTLVADFDRREGWADNFASCAEWLAWRTGRTLAAARENVRVAHALEELPLTATAMKGGRLSYTKVRTMTRVAAPETEATLLEYAQSTSAARLEWLVRGWKKLSRDGEVAAEEVRHQSRTFSVAVDADGMYVVRGRLEPEVGAVLMRAIEAASDALYRGEDADRRPRNRQRRADAAGLVAERALAAGFGGDETGDGPSEGAGCGGVGSGSRAERYQVVVHADAATLAERGETGRSELDGVRVSAETSRRMACDAARVAMCHRDGEVVSVGRRTRTIPPHIRRALEERDRGCRYPGCASRFTEAHHVKHWADGGETSLANTILLCRRHHRLVHEGGTRMALDRDGKAAFFTRAGQVLGTAPPLPEVARQLPEPPPPPPDRLSNGAPRFVDSAVPLSLELEALEAVA
ncbi:MAG: DUF222 domain-containing protein [Gemmatimonadota bacterium]|nr:DUF222 domain-containing protein [Gemmatimonadota bacterium]